MTLTKKIGYNSSVQFLGRLGMVLLSLVLVTFLTRYLGVEKYGHYTTILAFVALFNLFAEFGINQIIVREVSQKPRNRAKIMGGGLILKILISVVVFAIPPIIAYFLPYPSDVKWGILICSIATCPITIASLFVTIFQIHLKMHRYVIGSIAGRFLTLILSLLFIKTEKELIYFFIAILAGNILELFLDFVLAAPLEKIKIVFDKKLYKKIFLESWPMAVALGLGTVAFKVDTIILSLLKDQQAVGTYGVPYKVVDILITIPSIFMGLVLPVISRYVIKNKTKLNKSIQKSFDAMAVIGFYLFVVIALLAPFIINLIAGSGFAASTLPLRYLSLAICIIFLNAPLPYLLVAAGKQTQLIWRNLFSLIVNIILNLILIPYFSYNGAAVATILAELMSAVFTFYLSWQLLKILPSFKKVFGIIIATILSFTVGFSLIKMNVFISWQNFGNISFGYRALSFLAVFLIISFFYFLFLVLFKGIDRQILAQFIPIKIPLQDKNKK